MNHRLLWLLAFLVAVAAAGLHVYFFGHAGGFWRDEVNTLNLAGQDSLGEMRKDSFPLLFPLLVHGWLRVISDEATLRWLGLLVGLGTLATLCLASWKIQRTPPWVALVMFGLTPTVIVIGDSLRAYGLGTLLIVTVVFAAVWFLFQPGWGRFFLLAAACVLSVQTLYHNAVFVGAVCLAAMGICVRRKDHLALGQVFGAGALAALSLWPYFNGVIAGRENSVSLRTGLNPARLLNRLDEIFGFPMAQFKYVWLLLFAMLLWHGWWTWCRRKSSAEEPENFKNELPLFAALTVTISIFGFLGFLWLAALPSQSWYFLPLLAVLVTCLDLSWPQWPEKIRFVLLAFLLLSAALIFPLAWRILDVRFTNVDVWSRQLEKSVSAGDYVIVDPWFCGITFAHYFKPAVAWDTLPPLADHATHRYDLMKMQMQNTNAIVPVLEKISATLQSGHRVWVLALYGWMDVPEPGTFAAPPLPPAPLERTGWAEDPYTMAWVSKVAHQIGDQSRHFQREKNPAAVGRFMEETELFVADGWKTNQSAVAAGKFK